MEYSPEMLEQIARLLGIPTVQPNNRVWIVRTQKGNFYKDYSLNGFIALGWDNIPLRWIADENQKKDDVIECIKDEYPDEKRPGLIYGQMFDFVRVMAPGDCVVIPSEGSNYVNIGTIGEIFEGQDTSKLWDDDYIHCPYRLRRKVRWLKEASVSGDIYLSKMLRAQQTISDITKYAPLIYRNLHDFYFIDGTISLTLRKTTDTASTLMDEVTLLSAINETVKSVSEFYGEMPYQIEKKTAISSPGFLQFIAEKVTGVGQLVAFSQAFKTVGGKIKAPDGSSVDGIVGIAQGISNLHNDKADRHLKKAEEEKTYAEARKIDAEADVAKAQAEKLRAEANLTKATANNMLADANAQMIANYRAILGMTDVNKPSDELATEFDAKAVEFTQMLAKAEERQQAIAPALERMGIPMPTIEMESNVIPFPRKPEE